MRCLYKNLKKKKYQELCNRQNWPANAAKNFSAECASKARNVVLISGYFLLATTKLTLFEKMEIFPYFSVYYRDRRKTKHP
jgi:hypothetical protein